MMDVLTVRCAKQIKKENIKEFFGTSGGTLITIWDMKSWQIPTFFLKKWYKMIIVNWQRVYFKHVNKSF